MRKFSVYQPWKELRSPEQRGRLLDPLDGEEGGRRQRRHGGRRGGGGGGDGLHAEVHDERRLVVVRRRRGRLGRRLLRLS